jgi:hypothetical protein
MPALALSDPPMFRVDATEALLTALMKLDATTTPGSLSSDETFAIAVLKFQTARALIAARNSQRACTV